MQKRSVTQVFVTRHYPLFSAVLRYVLHDKEVQVVPEGDHLERYVRPMPTPSPP
jgi:hypothetical protein